MFDCDLSVKAVTDVTWELTAPLTWTGRTQTFEVPVGYVSDFASVPRFLHWLVSPYGGYTRAAVLHDWLITERINHPDPAMRVTSRDTDGIFRAAMQDLGVGWPRRWLMWSAVRLGALCNPKRAYGREFGKDAVKVFAIGLAVAPFVLPGVVGVLISLGAIRVETVIYRALVHLGVVRGTARQTVAADCSSTPPES